MKLLPHVPITSILSALFILQTICVVSAATEGGIDATNHTCTIQNTVRYGDKEITYYTKGPSDGPILIFMHGWPAIAETWRSQIDYFSQLGYFVVAPDMPGYGRSTARNVTADYAHENIITGLLAMLEDTGRKSAVWVGHDWGAAVGSSLVAVHPEVVDAMAWLAVPYKTAELGYEYMLQFVNRSVYPEPTFHYGQWDYMVYYQTRFNRVTNVFESDYGYSVKSIYASSGGNASLIGTRSPSAYITADHGWFCGVNSLPPPNGTICPPGQSTPPSSIPLNDTVLDGSLYHKVVTALKNTTFNPANQYYLNQQSNKEYNENNQKNNGTLNMPALFIQADYDPFLDTIDSTLLHPMLAHCRDFSFASVPTGHWVYLEAPDRTNEAIAHWLSINVMSCRTAAMI